MKLSALRHIAAWVMLAVYLPIFVASSLHVHHAERMVREVCAQCQTHQCTGHVTQPIAPSHECVLCQFQSLPYLTGIDTTLPAMQRMATATLTRPYVHSDGLSAPRIVGLRAPPTPWL